MFMLIHFSCIYTEDEIIDFFQKQPYENIKPWITDRELQNPLKEYQNFKI